MAQAKPPFPHTNAPELEIAWKRIRQFAPEELAAFDPMRANIAEMTEQRADPRAKGAPTTSGNWETRDVKAMNFMRTNPG